MSEQTTERQLPQNRENPHKPLVYQSPQRNGFWRAVAFNSENLFECEIGRSLTEAYSKAVTLANRNAEAQQ